MAGFDDIVSAEKSADKEFKKGPSPTMGAPESDSSPPLPPTAHPSSASFSAPADGLRPPPYPPPGSPHGYLPSPPPRSSLKPGGLGSLVLDVKSIGTPYCPFSATEQKFYLGSERHPADKIYLEGIRHWQGYETPIHYLNARQCFKNAAEKGHVRAQYHLAYMLLLEQYGGGTATEQLEAQVWFKKAYPEIEKQAVAPTCADAWAVYALAEGYRRGLGYIGTALGIILIKTGSKRKPGVKKLFPY